MWSTPLRNCLHRTALILDLWVLRLGFGETYTEYYFLLLRTVLGMVLYGLLPCFGLSLRRPTYNFKAGLHFLCNQSFGGTSGRLVPVRLSRLEMEWNYARVERLPSQCRP